MNTSGRGFEALLAVSGLSVRVGGRTILEPIDLTLGAGEWKAIVGPNGAGKSTLLKAVAALVPHGGAVVYRGRRISDDPLTYRAELGVLLHEPMLYDELTALENLVYYARLYGLKDPRVAAREKLELVGLALYAHEPVGRFSRGMVQRLALARALLHEPKLLLLDEPLTGIDAKGESLVLRLFRQAKERGAAALWVTHRWQKAWEIVDEVVEMQRGRIVSATPTRGRRADEWIPAFVDEPPVRR